MKEKELRIALVCFGGVSLAVYMHGISKEILKLVRASCALHAIADREKRAQAEFAAQTSPSAEHDSEAIYFELLRDLGRSVELRVIVDIIAGASAGGINGTMLARALSHDLPMGPLRDLWLDHADVADLLAPEARPTRWSKLLLVPVIWALGRTGRLPAMQNPEVRRKLSMFLRSRWFKPPLSGSRMAELMHQAITAMGVPAHPRASLLPSGIGLDLFVTVTDHYGYGQLVQIHDPPLIQEREHRHVLHFRYRRDADGSTDSDFTLGNAPALAFAARATSSFPGAFPPAQIAEIDRLIAAGRGAWPDRQRFLARNFARYPTTGDPVAAAFVDGAVLNNRPFREAIAAIRGRPAYREVDRRLIYIDPDPIPADVPAPQRMPGFFAALKGALSDIPSTQPVVDELSWVVSFNERVRRIRSIIDEARPRVSRLVGDAVTPSLEQPLAAEQVRRWRQQVHDRVVRDAGFAYEGYVRLKLASVRAFASALIARLAAAPPRTPRARAIAEVVDAWAIASRLTYDAPSFAAADFESMPGNPVLPRWVKFLLAFDVDYRRRRLHFMVEGQNRLYQMLDEHRFGDLDRAVIDRLKRSFYDRLDALNRREQPAHFSAATRTLALTLFASPPSAAQARDLPLYARDFVQRHRLELDELIGGLAREIDLAASTDEIDALLAATDPREWHPQARREVLVNYLGFPFWDVLTFPVMTWREAGEFNEILVDRISPQDARTLGAFSGAQSLMGVGFGHFAAFFSRGFRERDYLLGRLHGLDRLIDIICDAAGMDPDHPPLDLVALKRKAFSRILDVEEPHLPNSTQLVAELRQAIASLGAVPLEADTPPG